MMNGHGKSDRPTVPMKSSNKAGQPAAEGMEGKGLAEGNLRRQNAPRTPSREGAHSALERVRQAARRDRKMRFTALLHHVYNVETLRVAFFSLKREAAPGVDGQTWRHYGEALEENLQDLSDRLKRGAYRAKPVRRVFIPKADGRQRPLGVTALEDKIVQRATVEVLNAIYETDFLGFSYGFRPGRSQHKALDALYAGLLTRKVNWVLDIDIRGFLDASSYYTPSEGCESKRPGIVAGTLILKPLRRPWCTWTAWSSPRFTRCNTVCRETPRMRVASSIGMYPSGAFSTKRERSSSLMRMRQGAPGVSCSAAIKPSFNQRWTVEGATPRISAALCILTSSPSGEVDDSAGSKRGIPQ
jgi:hypothetical protein